MTSFRFLTFTFWNSYVLKLLRSETLPSSGVTLGQTDKGFEVHGLEKGSLAVDWLYRRVRVIGATHGFQKSYIGRLEQ